MARSVFRVLVIGLMTVIGLGSLPALAGVVVSAVRILSTREIADEDDMCFWLHPKDLSRSTVISSDKKARSLFVYDLEGHLLQAIASPEPGNVDVRYGFPLGGREVDIVAFNDRETQRIRVYAVDPATRLLSRVDDDGILTGKNYGFTLYRSATSGRTYAFTGAKAETVVQEWELVDDGTGRVAGIGPFRHLRPGGVCEGMVSDDETGKLYVSQETGGVWKYDAEPTAGNAGSRIATVGEHGLMQDVEGITLYYRAGGAGYLIVSSQGNDEFKVYDRRPPHRYLGAFRVDGNAAGDGCDVTSLPLDSTFSSGAFVCHNGIAKPFADQLVKWSEIAHSLGLVVDSTYWDPRRATRTLARTTAATRAD